MMLQLKKSDLHFHSIRDKRYKDDVWAPKGLDVLEEWANDVISYCEEEGINLIAVTDHNDFWPSLELKRVIEGRGKIDAIWILGGMEILSAEGIQFIVYFDLNYYDPDKLKRLCGTLGIEDPKQNIKEKISENARSSRHLKDIIVELNSGADKNHTLVCPVLEGSTGLFRATKDAINIYKMEGIVGGVVSRKYSNANLCIVEGNDPNYNSKPIGVLVTSDARKLRKENSASENEIGSAVTWIKISEPKCNALKQALISGKEKRLFYEEPSRPLNYISKLTIRNSNLFKKELTVDFHDEYNTIVGGRGTGKSLILFALMKILRQDFEKFHFESGINPPSWIIDQEEKFNGLFEEKGPFAPGTTIAVELKGEININIECEISGLNEYNYRWKYLEHSDFSDGFPETDITDLCQFIQGELSEIGRSPERFREMLLYPIQSEQRKILGEIENARSHYATAVKTQYEYIHGKKQLEEFEKKEKLLSEQTKSLRETLEGDLNQKEKADLENSQQFMETMHALLFLKASNKDKILSFERDTKAIVDFFSHQIEILKAATFIDAKWNDELRKIEDALRQWNKQIGEANILLGDIPPRIDVLEKKAVSYKDRIEKVQRKIKGREELKNRLQKLAEELAELRVNKNKTIRWLDENSEISKNVTATKNNWVKKLQERADLLEGRAQKIHNIKNSHLKIEVLRGHGLSKALGLFKEICKGSYASDADFDNIAERLRDGDPIKNWNLLISELILAVQRKRYGEKIEDEFEILKVFSHSIREKIIAKLVDTPEGFDKILTAELTDDLKINYRSEAGEEIDISKASYGQQAVEFLKIALGETGISPLIIDQPEDDLDNDFIQNELLKLIYEIRLERQIIFVSHNANLVVNGDSGAIVIMDRRIEKEGVKLDFKNPIGTIDQDYICTSIKHIMEGGEEAFLLRKRKYSI